MYFVDFAKLFYLPVLASFTDAKLLDLFVKRHATFYLYMKFCALGIQYVHSISLGACMREGYGIISTKARFIPRTGSE